MSQEKTTLEIIAPTVDEAVARGLNQLGISREMVDVEVLDTGSRGLFGLGSRQARIRLKFKSTESHPVAQPPSSEAPVVPVSTPAAPAKEAEVSVAGDPQILKSASAVVGELLDKMSMKATVNASYVQNEEDEENPMVLVEVQGNDLSILIGRRSETLNALQYIASLIVCKEVGHWVPMTIDIQGYRQRRERQLRQMARRMAEQAVHTGRRQVLEPMPANERRVIHLELRDHPLVTTESTGEEPNRKVTIILKKQG
ncbi:predicted RNA-binding protein [Longilinea arvoryzae]|uniref:RNA-binding protein KhpB n=1 Tax=Longilinea arvoryzae TaxID=360412 RepID=A0A0S7BKJ7_9CHLR|nr:RNA-binding cell elongation regulator Jag/EloR [Longilinea arvoryzae]GAP15155.1 predicted RNA-binding protein [Longilinea arvoryzae]